MGNKPDKYESVAAPNFSLEVRTVAVKYRKMIYNIDFELDSPIKKFRKKLYEKTGVPERFQKVVYKGKLIKDDTDLLSLDIADGDTLMLLGESERNDLISFRS
eukprot:TRINITY_DN5731_c0_g1_i2.p1 TRINITY_DN5731_c0_g1~~TRINITY_DN5731_c0_g1_i2.p1  ORF type:complete len:103 (-),score=11.46 TRINITY_DN5731_c0_g1_i2:33-341(-)